MADIAFLLTRSGAPPDPSGVVAHAAALGLPLELSEETSSRISSEISSFSIRDGRPGIMISTFLPVPHPDAPNMIDGPLSPSEEDLAEAESHMILVGFGIEGNDADRDRLMCMFTTAVSQATDSIGAMLGDATNFHRVGVCSELAGLIQESQLPPDLAVTVKTELRDSSAPSED